tara:strand:- start:1510 stop:2448 length:939 start_codon:yes stop_codon:yes gene_type:complete
MRILITGVAGFIGFHLTKKLLQKGYEITGIDNINDYYSQSLKIHRLTILKSKNFFFKELDINQIESMNNEFDLVINLAAQAGVRLSEEKKSNYQYSNIDGFKKVIDYCITNSIGKVIYASSSSVYDDSSSQAFSENTTNLKPKSLYGETKLFNENYAEEFKDKIDLLGLRFFSVYGPLGRPDMAYFSFTESIKNQEMITLHNSGSMARDMTFIDDAIDGIINSINFIINPKNEIKNEIFNIGNDSPILTSKLLETLERKLKITAQIQNIEVLNESSYTHANLDKSRKILGYNPSVRFEDGIDDFLEWHKNYE